MGGCEMLNRTEQVGLGRQLRAMYEGIPKGGIPDRIWKLLLRVERLELHRAAKEKRQSGVGATEDRVWRG